MVTKNKYIQNNRISHVTSVNIKRSFPTVMQKYLDWAIWTGCAAHSRKKTLQYSPLWYFLCLLSVTHLASAFPPPPCPLISNFTDLALSFAPVYPVPFSFSIFLCRSRPPSPPPSVSLYRRCSDEGSHFTEPEWWQMEGWQQETRTEREETDWGSTWEMTRPGWFNLLCFMIFFFF